MQLVYIRVLNRLCSSGVSVRRGDCPLQGLPQQSGLMQWPQWHYVLIRKKTNEQRNQGFFGGHFLGFQFPKMTSTDVIIVKILKKATWIQKLVIGDSYNLGNLYLTFVGIYLYVLFQSRDLLLSHKSKLTQHQQCHKVAPNHPHQL